MHLASEIPSLFTNLQNIISYSGISGPKYMGQPTLKFSLHNQTIKLCGSNIQTKKKMLDNYYIALSILFIY